MASWQTRPGAASVDDLLEALDPAKRADSAVLIAMMTEVTGEQAVRWGSMIGFGKFHYRYESGHQGDTFILGFAPRKAEFSLYLFNFEDPAADGARQDLLARLGKHRMGKACLYIKRLADIDPAVLRQLARLGTEAVRKAYP